MSDYPYAKYTETFKEFCANNPTFLEDTIIMHNIDGSVNSDYSNSLISMLKSVYNIYEIAGETEGEQKEFIKDTFDRHRRYYEEMLEAYNKTFDYTTGIIVKRTRDSGTTHTEGGKDSTTRDPKGNLVTDTKNEDYGYDLPRTTQTESKPSSKATSSGNTKVNYDEYSVVDEVSYGHTRKVEEQYSDTLTDNSQYLIMKNQYMRQIRDLYAEFAMRFWDCFLHIF